MGYLGDLICGLLKVFGVSPPQQGPPEPVYPGAGRPSSAQQPHQLAGYPPQHRPGSAHPQQTPQQQHYRPQPQPHQNQWNSSSSSSPQPLQHPASSRPTHGQVDQNAVNQQNEYYLSLRARANQEGDAMARAFEQSHAAYERKDGASAKEFSNEGKAHQKEMNRLNAEASAWIFRENNLDSKPGEVDVHGLYVKEAISYTDRSIVEARARGDKELRLIVGKGIHSPNHAAKLKPAIEELMQKHNLAAAIDPHNAGVLIVQLEGGTAAKESGGVILGADDIMRRLDRQDEGCIVM